MGLNTGYLTAEKTDESNENYTPYYGVDPIVKYISKDKIIWCPCDEEWSAFYQTFKQNGYQVIRSSLSEGKDFFTYEPDKWDVIVTNPPFNIKDKILERLYSFNKPFAVVLLMNSLQGKARYKYFKEGIQLLSFDKRICFHNPDSMEHYIKGSPFASAYFCRDLLPKNLIVEELIEYEKPLKKDLELEEIMNVQYEKWKIDLDLKQ